MEGLKMEAMKKMKMKKEMMKLSRAMFFFCDFLFFLLATYTHGIKENRKLK
jgi:hypothetical protein